MSVEDEVEMKDLLMQTLTENGCLAKIRAQLRASVFLALDEDIKLNRKKPLFNDKMKECLDSAEGQLMFCLVKEFLEFFNLQSTLAVFEAESYLGVSCQYKGRTKVSEELGLNEDEKIPLLYQMIHLVQCQTKNLEVNLNMVENFQDIEINNGETSIKTERDFNELCVNNNSSSIVMKEYGLTVNNMRSTDNSNSLYENEVNLNKTFTTDTTLGLKQSELYTDLMGHLVNDKQKSIEEVPKSQVTLPMPISEKNDEVATPILRDLKISLERVKSPPKSEKFKSKSNLNSLTDLPTLNMNKCKPGSILPSLYTKEFKEKSNS